MDSDQLAELAAEACDDRKAKEIKLIKVDEITYLTEWILITEGLSDVQVRSIIKSVEDKLIEETGRLPLRREGINEAKWALLDYGEIIVHVLQPSEREYYELEAFWSNGKKVSFQPQNSILNEYRNGLYIFMPSSKGANTNRRIPKTFKFLVL